MFVQVLWDGFPHRIQDEIDPFPSREFRGRDEVRVTRNEHDLVDLPLERQGRNIQADPHIYALLRDIVGYVGGGKIGRRERLRQEPFRRTRLDGPGCAIGQASKPERDFPSAFEPSMQELAEFGLAGLREIDYLPGNWMLPPIQEGRAIVEEDPIQFALLPGRTGLLASPPRGLKVQEGPCDQAVDDLFGALASRIANQETVALDEESAIGPP